MDWIALNNIDDFIHYSRFKVTGLSAYEKGVVYQRNGLKIVTEPNYGFHHGWHVAHLSELRGFFKAFILVQVPTLCYIRNNSSVLKNFYKPGDK